MINRDWIFVGLCCVAIVLHFTMPATTPNNIPLISVIILGGIPLIFDILRQIIKGEFGVDLLAALSIIMSLILGEYLAGVLVVLMLSGGSALERYAATKASSALKSLANRAPRQAQIRIGGLIKEIAVEDIRIGDEIVILPHTIVPVDGVVIEGHGSMDESFLTGEPYQMSKAPGVEVISGAVNADKMIVIRATKQNSESRYAKILQVMEMAEQNRPKMRRLADKLGAFFTPIALIIAFFAWYITGDSVRFLAVIIIATPCPLLIAVPITIISAISMAAERGIVIRNPVALEQLPLCETAIFDKTGTLTYGRPSVTRIIASPDYESDHVLQLAASLEKFSKHPLASAIIRTAQEKNLDDLDVSELSEPPGQGLLGIINSRKIQITHRRALKDSPILEKLPEAAPGMECIVLIDGTYGATIQFRDTPRQEGGTFIQHLSPSHGFKKIMLVSGDRESEVAYLAQLMGIKSALFSQTPEQKLELVRQETQQAKTVFMGDGINDAPAIAAATVGLAFGDPTDVTAEAADVVIMANSLEKVDELIHISLNMRHIALQSAVGGMALCFVGMIFAALGYVPPVWGALTQEVIDVVAILNALRFIWSDSYKSDMT